MIKKIPAWLIVILFVAPYIFFASVKFGVLAGYKHWVGCWAAGANAIKKERGGALNFFRPEDFELAGHTVCGHQALLINIEELPKLECEHEPYRISCAEEGNGMGHEKLSGFKPECTKCGIKLKASWSPA